MRGRGLRLEVRDNLGDLVDVIEYSISGLNRLDRKIPARGRFKGSDSLGSMWADDWRESRRRHFLTQGRSNGTPILRICLRSAPGPRASRPSAISACTANSAEYSKYCAEKSKKARIT